MSNDTNSSSSTGDWNATAVAALTPVDMSTCESVSYGLTVSTIIIAGLLIGIAPKLYHKSGLMRRNAIFILPILMYMVNHVYYDYLRTYVDAVLSASYPTLSYTISQFLPVSIAAILYFPVNRSITIVGVVCNVSLVWLVVSRLGIAASLSTIIGVLVFSALLYQQKYIHEFVSDIVLTIVFAFTCFLGIISFSSPRDGANACGHNRNLIVLCYPECGTITTNFVVDPALMSTAIIVTLFSFIFGQVMTRCGPFKDKKDKEKGGSKDDGTYEDPNDKEKRIKKFTKDIKRQSNTDLIRTLKETREEKAKNTRNLLQKSDEERIVSQEVIDRKLQDSDIGDIDTSNTIINTGGRGRYVRVHADDAIRYDSQIHSSRIE
jgi:hypothetical protein